MRSESPRGTGGSCDWLEVGKIGSRHGTGCETEDMHACLGRWAVFSAQSGLGLENVD